MKSATSKTPAAFAKTLVAIAVPAPGRLNTLCAIAERLNFKFP
jgi:hypothetical protein